MKSLIKFAALVALASITTGCEDKRIPNLEKRVADLEEKTKQLETEKTKAAGEQSQREFLLRACVADANAQYQRGIMDNGEKGKGGTYSLPVTTANQLDRQKQNKIEECKLLYR